MQSEQSEEVLAIMEQIVSHPQLSVYFNPPYTIMNERDIFTREGKVLRPDRLAIDERKQITVIDYKTGKPHPDHQVQIDEYAKALYEMDFGVKEKLLVYCSYDGIQINKA
jgi:RecB family endonuclease NucS